MKINISLLALTLLSILFTTSCQETTKTGKVEPATIIVETKEAMPGVMQKHLEAFEIGIWRHSNPPCPRSVIRS